MWSGQADYSKQASACLPRWASRRGRSVPNALVVAFDRTPDLYHVKAGWPHQDTLGQGRA